MWVGGTDAVVGKETLGRARTQGPVAQNHGARAAGYRAFDTRHPAWISGGCEEPSRSIVDKASTVAMAMLSGLIHDGPIHGGIVSRVSSVGIHHPGAMRLAVLAPDRASEETGSESAEPPPSRSPGQAGTTGQFHRFRASQSNQFNSLTLGSGPLFLKSSPNR